MQVLGTAPRKAVKDTFNVARGLAGFLAGREADTATWHALLDLHCSTNGHSTEIVRGLMRRLRPAHADPAPFSSYLGEFNASSVGGIADRIRTDGYYVFNSRVPADLCDEIRLATTRIEARIDRKAEARTGIFDPHRPLGYVYDYSDTTCLQIPAYQRLVADPIFVNLSQAYFNASPALSRAIMWWSSSLDGKPDTDAAQLFHFDYDQAPVWLKYFVYLTDVDADTGPHIYVRGSHRQRRPEARELVSRHYVRIADDEIERTYGPDNVVELTGPKGTVLAVDTLGFHKGKPPLRDHRLLAQLTYSSPLFVPKTSAPIKLPQSVDPALKSAINMYPWAFERFRM